MTNIILIFFLKVMFGIIPGITPELSWTLTTLTYNIVRPFFGALLCSYYCLFNIALFSSPWRFFLGVLFFCEHDNG
jgi:hypothetical protein